ncbi:MAG: hypothetical protein NUV53_02865 [Patescibacteria group bacterium]|nr:hypothetical protein [Patescibacteria group bacterium]
MTTSLDISDESIALEVQRGGVDIFGELVMRYEGKLARYGRRFLASNDDVKDVVQEVFLKAYINIKGFDASRCFYYMVCCSSGCRNFRGTCGVLLFCISHTSCRKTFPMMLGVMQYPPYFQVIEVFQ